MMRLAAAYLFAVATLGAGQAPPPAAMEPAGDLSGALVAVGGGKIPAGVREEFIKYAGGAKAKVVVIAPADSGEPALAAWENYKVPSLKLLPIHSNNRAKNETNLGSLKEASGVWLGEGILSYLTSPEGATLAKAVKEVFGKGGVVGASASDIAPFGAHMMAGLFEVHRPEGLGLVSQAVFDAHHLVEQRGNLLENYLGQNPGLYGLGVDDGTAAILKGRTLTVRGESFVVTFLSAGAGRPALRVKVKQGEKVDLIALSRSAIARTQPPWPPEKPPTPSVPRGMLIIGGGGKMPPEVIKRFIDGAGPSGHIVFIPTASEDPVPEFPVEAKTFVAAGATSLKVLHTRQRSVANSDAFVKEFEKAKGIWFGGGRQWRFVDSYLDTKAEKAMHGVLERGGVIGGSSAGASIQADYMVRGDPLGNLKPMAEGYERGLGFIQGVAIDQHFFKRNRPPDMTTVMAAHPQLLGIGIDEQTAIVVKGEVFEVMGLSKVAVYNRHKPVVAGQPDYEELTNGMRYDLKNRKTLKEK